MTHNTAPRSTTDETADHYARTLNYAHHQPYVGIGTDQITVNRTGGEVTGYTVTGLLTRHIAHRTAIAALSSFDTVPDERAVAVRLIPPPPDSADTAWSVRVHWTAR